MRSHILIYFAQRPAGSAKPAGSGWSPTPGAHVALQIRLDPPSPFGDPDRVVPYVTLEPRLNNNPVVALQRLAAPTLGTPRLFQVQPTLSEAQATELGQVRDIVDWLVLAAPAPLGLIAPRELAAGLVYLGREEIGTYGLFVYSTAMFAVRKLVTEGLRITPVGSQPSEVERRLADLAVQSTNGVLRMGRSPNGAMWEQLGVLMATEVSAGIQR